MTDMNRQVRYDEFVAITRRATLDLADSPRARLYENRFKENSVVWPGEKEEEKRRHDDRFSFDDAKEWTQSELFESECKRLYAARV